jgi:phosphohistidine phosphatase
VDKKERQMISSVEIFLMRHGIAADLQPGQADADRELTTKGINKTDRVAIAMWEAGWQFDLVMASPLVRARQTAQILLETGLSDMLEINPNLAPDGVFTNWLQSHQATKSAMKRLMLVGHAPNLSQWAEMLVFGQVIDRLQLKKAGVIMLQVPDDGEIIGKCILLGIVPPKCWV